MFAKVKKVAFWGLITFSIFSLVFSPLGETKNQLESSAIWLLAGVFLTETLFISGIAIMAAAIGLKIRNPLKLRRELKNVLLAGFRSKLFWVGFWINAAGAIGTTALIGVGILTVLPAKSWGLIVLVITDLSSTVVLRHYVLQKRNSHPVTQGEQ